ncbi:MAG TPA: alpha/beta hydrolase [Candidatus Sulfotelmatobacter sp.]|nr:alpha/beta hydrolase [Candidatus Sulfotelmatobacter sp.]
MAYFFWIVLLAIAAAAATWAWIDFARWKSATLARLRDGAQIIATPKGPIECAVSGEGPVILISHGALGGYDQGLAAISSGFFGERPCRFIAVSRPGYLRTPPEIGKTPEEQADAFAALLDALKIQKAIIVGISGGGPPSLQFALRHPGRCAALFLVSAVTERIPQPKLGILGLFLRVVTHTDFVAWITLGLARRYPRLFFRSILSSGELGRIRDPGVAAAGLRLMDSTMPFSARRAGLMIDANFITELRAYPLVSIRVPTLLVHGTNDKIVPFVSSEHTAAAIPGARLIPIKRGSHLACLLGARDLSPEVSKFLDTVVS